MTLNELIQQGWADHADKTADVADRLEAGLELVEDAKGAAAYMNLVNHAIGDHMGDRGRALRLSEGAAERVDDVEEAMHLPYLAVSRHLAGDAAGAAEVEKRIGDDPSVSVRVSMLVAQGHVHAGDWGAAADLYGRTLTAAESLPEGNAGERAVAVVSNNIAAEVLDLDSVDEEQAALMEKAAHAGRTFWLRVGTWVNSERADYLLAGVHNKLGRYEEARTFADRALQTIHDNGEEKVDEAFIHLSRAAACKGLGDEAGYAASLETAKTLADGFDDPGLKSWFEGELKKVE